MPRLEIPTDVVQKSNLDISMSHASMLSTSRLSTARSSKRSKRVKFRTTKKAKILADYKNLLEAETPMNMALQEKMNFYYGPYEKVSDAGVPVAVKYDTDRSFENKKISETSKDNWKSISSKVLKASNDDFKDLVKAVNRKFYYRIRKASLPTKREGGLGMKLFKNAMFFRVNKKVLNVPRRAHVRTSSSHTKDKN